MKKVSKVFIILCIVIVSTFFPTYKSYAANNLSPSDIVNRARNFLNDADDKNEILDPQKGKDTIDRIYYVGLAIAAILAVCIGIVLGIQFITTGAQGQAKVKEKLIPYVVGIFVVFAVFGIWKLAYTALSSVDL